MPGQSEIRNQKSEIPLVIRPFRSTDEGAVIALWESCDLVRPWNDPKTDIALKLQDSPDLFLVGEHEGKIIATAMAGYDGHRGWVNYLAVAPTAQGNGFGRDLMDEVERLLKAHNCPKINVQVRTSNKAVIAFYESLGYTLDDCVGLGKRLDGKIRQ